MPLGFGAERANLMGEAPVTMPTNAGGSSVNPGDDGSAAGESSVGAQDLMLRANNAKTNLI